MSEDMIANLNNYNKNLDKCFHYILTKTRPKITVKNSKICTEITSAVPENYYINIRCFKFGFPPVLTFFILQLHTKKLKAFQVLFCFDFFFKDKTKIFFKVGVYKQRTQKCSFYSL